MSEGSRLRRSGVVLLVLGTGLIVAALGLLGWQRVVRRGILSDLAYQRQLLQRSPLTEEERGRLRERLRLLEEEVRRDRIGMGRWVRACRTLDPVVEDGRISAREVRRILSATEELVRRGDPR